MLKFLRPINDIHLDFYVPKKITQLEESLWYPKALSTDSETALIIAGDLWHSGKFLQFNHFSWLGKISEQFLYVIFVLGNHDLWRGNITEDYKKVKEEIKKQNLSNVYLLQDESIILEGIRFTGATLWTDYSNNFSALSQAKDIMKTDFKTIRYGKQHKKLMPHDVRNAHIHSRNFIFGHAIKTEDIRKNVVITHHAPSYESIASKYKNEGYTLENYYDYSNLDEQIKQSSIDLWFHGHTHEFKNYYIGNTQIINNPLGYYGIQNDTQFNDSFLIELDDLEYSHKKQHKM